MLGEGATMIKESNACKCGIATQNHTYPESEELFIHNIKHTYYFYSIALYKGLTINKEPTTVWDIVVYHVPVLDYPQDIYSSSSKMEQQQQKTTTRSTSSNGKH